jgi:uncharacterized membrane protein affecting hemolysin expression
VLSIAFHIEIFDWLLYLKKLINGFLRQVWDTKTSTTKGFHVIALSHAKILAFAALIVVLGTLLDFNRTYKKVNILKFQAEPKVAPG